MYKKRILITGVGGFIGSRLKEDFISLGYDVWGIGNHYVDEEQIFNINLLNLESLQRIARDIPKCDFLIHAAAQAHGEKIVKQEDIISNNLNITKNLVSVFKNKFKNFIFLSSVAVYGEYGRIKPILSSDFLKPSSDYGKSKLLCESFLKSSGIKSYVILRLCPVFSQKNLKDIKKRVFFPGSKFFKMLFYPEPFYSLLNINTLIKALSEFVVRENLDNQIINISDKIPYGQKELSTWFSGKSFHFFSFLIEPFFILSYLLPKNICYKIQCNLWKLIKSNIYE